jgi:hypothetical protein
MTRLAEPIIVAQWWRNRRGEAVWVQLSTWQDHNLIDVRTWRSSSDGKLVPGKGFAADVRHLPRLAAALARAEAKATELGLISADNDNGGDQ